MMAWHDDDDDDDDDDVAELVAGLQAKNIANALIEQLQQAAYNLRTLDQLAAKAYFYYARTYELTGDYASIRSALLAAYRTACLRHDLETQVYYRSAR
jgi:26S proteasome regulatory subunit N3